MMCSESLGIADYEVKKKNTQDCNKAGSRKGSLSFFEQVRSLKEAV